MSGKPRVRGLLVADDEVLLVRNWLGSQEWTFSGGGLSGGESSQQALIREVSEELGLNLDQATFRKVLACDETEGSANFTVTILEAPIDKNAEFKVKFPEIIEASWFPINMLPENTKTIVSEAIKARKK